MPEDSGYFFVKAISWENPLSAKTKNGLPHESEKRSIIEARQKIAIYHFSSSLKSKVIISP